MLSFKDSGPVISTVPAAVPSNATPLRGKYVTLEAYTQNHTPELFKNLGMWHDQSVFEWVGTDIPNTPDELWKMLGSAGEQYGFVVYVLKADPEHLNPRPGCEPPGYHTKVLGTLAYSDIDPNNRELEVGAVLFGPSLQRSAAATEAHYLLLRNVCEPRTSPDSPPPYRRVAWRCNHHNVASRRAAGRIGFVYEGTFRKNMIVRGRSRDTAWQSIVDDDWPAIKSALEEWLDEKNFDDNGRQLQRLEDIRARIKADSDSRQ